MPSDGDRTDEHGGHSSESRMDDTGIPAVDTSSESTVDTSSDPIAETVELGVELLAHLEHDELTLKQALDRIETLTTDPAVTREILDTAEMRGIIDRDGGIIRPTSGQFVSFGSDVVRREGEFTCRRCGKNITTGHFVVFDAGEHGPFGSSCIRKVTGRE